MRKFVAVAKITDLKDNAPFCAEAESHKISLYKIGDDFFATDNVCTHAGGPLCEGKLNGKIITCPWHASEFDVTTGEVVGGPTTSPVKIYKTQVNGDSIEVEID